MLEGGPEGKERKETVGDVVVAQRIAELKGRAGRHGFTLGETSGTQPVLEDLRENIRKQVKADLGAIADYPIAKDDLVHPGDNALFRIPGGSVLLPVKSVSREWIEGAYAGIRLDSTIVITRDGLVLIGRVFAENDLAKTPVDKVK